MEQQGYVQVSGGRVFYKKVGNGKGVPLLLLHGGPGGTHNGFKDLEELGEDRPIIFYDQLGSGKSDRPTDKSLWELDRYIEELGQVREALGLEHLHILGHSWGTMLAASYMLTKPGGIKSVIFSSPCLSAPQWAKDQKRHLKELPIDVQETIIKCESEGDIHSEIYLSAVKVFNERYVCRRKEVPAKYKPAKGAFNQEVYEAMWGSSEFNPTGRLKNYDVTDQLHQLHLPVLFTCGRYDEATPQTTKGYSEKVAGAKFHVFENSAHMPYIEESKNYIQVIGRFLRDLEK